ncbi:hypothetical protein DY000_02045518 [Brassica cretica]|uniref:Uncharacterized protein n=1 Tax=Brassica cretica TaxID=69181 RepID=A0ABQ7EYF0_BRACR|nr:hypothetical protein DY000_02045518 [Brassica cretica]
MYVPNGLKLRRIANGSKQLSGRERAGYRTVSVASSKLRSCLANRLKSRAEEQTEVAC